MTVKNGELYGAHACPNGVDSPRQLRMTLPAVSHSVRLSRHARGTDVVTVDLHAGQSWLRIEVLDTDRHWPKPRVPDGFDESGFGFILVEALADNWGVRETDAGKAVWAELGTRQG